MTAHIRPAEPRDAAAILALWREAAAVTTRTDDVEGVRRLVDHDPGALLVAESEGELVGTVVAGWDGWRGSIYRLVVAPGARRHGLATRLLRCAEERLDGLGARRMQATVVANDRQAMGFWERSGWHPQSGQVRFTR